MILRILLQVLEVEHVCSTEKDTKRPIQKLQALTVMLYSFTVKVMYELKHAKKPFSSLVVYSFYS